ADGTESAPAGWAWVGERGPELRKLRAGDVIRSNPRSMQMAQNNNSTPVTPKIDLHVTVVGGSGDEHIRTLSRQGAQEAISEYHQGQISGGFGETQRRYASQKG
ncbi:phage tail tape measure protein, partial [Mesorhizobium sp. BHbdii]